MEDSVYLVKVDLEVVMNKNIAEGSHPLKFLKELFRNHLLLNKYFKHLGIGIRFTEPAIRYNVVAYVKDAFD